MSIVRFQHWNLFFLIPCACKRFCLRGQEYLGTLPGEGEKCAPGQVFEGF